MVSTYLLLTDTTEGITSFTTSVTSVTAVVTVWVVTASVAPAELSSFFAVSSFVLWPEASSVPCKVSWICAVSVTASFALPATPFIRLLAVLTASKPTPAKTPKQSPQHNAMAIFFPAPIPFFSFLSGAFPTFPEGALPVS